MSSTWEWPPGWRRIRAQVFRRDGRRCYRCGGYANTVDHILPVVLGGSHALSNLQACCGHCNSSTGASVGNRLRPRRPRQLTGAQRRAIALKARTGGAPVSGWQSARRW